ncbi:MAG: hypothetical protein QNJ22_02920 [Desulfosarcinaceae bacterium]|nr:hypothetical protein [Desulfosarcinaceae bacterium]
MKWIEVIMVRSAGSEIRILTKTLKGLMTDVARGAGRDDIRVFHRENLETDICIVLFHRGKKTHTGGSSLGLRIVTELKSVGLVHHTIWNEVER